MKEHLSRSLLIGVDFSDEDTGVLIVGEKQGADIKIINVFKGKEAHELYEKIVTPVAKKDQ